MDVPMIKYYVQKITYFYYKNYFLFKTLLGLEK